MPFAYIDYDGDAVSVSNGVVRIDSGTVQLTTRAARELAAQLNDWADSMEED